MESYIDFANRLTLINNAATESEFIRWCGEVVTVNEFGVDLDVVKFVLASHQIPTLRIIDGELLVKSKLVPFSNTLQAFEFMTKVLGMGSADIALVQDDNRVSFALSMSGMQLLGREFEAVRGVLDHAQWIMKGLEAYGYREQ